MRDGDLDWAACGGTTATGTVDSVIKCYHDRISAPSARPAGTSFAGIGWTDEGEGKFSCGGAGNAPLNTVVAGPWSRLFPKEVRAQVASGPQAQFCALDPTTTLASACTTVQYCYSPSNVGPTDWFPEATYEPYKLKADPAGRVRQVRRAADDLLRRGHPVPDDQANAVCDDRPEWLGQGGTGGASAPDKLHVLPVVGGPGVDAVELAAGRPLLRRYPRWSR